MFGSLFHGIRCLIWFPFAVTSSLAFVVIVNVYVYLCYPGISTVTFWLSFVLCGLTMPIEHSLRPAPRQPKLKGPPQEKQILPQLAVMLMNDKGQAPSLAQTRRTLPKELRALLAAPVTRPPEAVTHDHRVIAQQAAQGGRRAA